MAQTKSATCEEAIRKIWPAHLQEQALLVAKRESGLRPGAVGVNAPGNGRDHGCMQINDKYHFGSKGWRNFADIYDPEFNVSLGYKIYQGRGNFSAWYAVRGLLW